MKTNDLYNLLYQYHSSWCSGNTRSQDIRSHGIDLPDENIPGWVPDGLTHLSMDKMAVISQTIFSYAFSWMKNFALWFKFLYSLFARVQLTITQHWFDNGLALDRQQAIIWTNADLIHWRIYAALGWDELTQYLDAEIYSWWDATLWYIPMLKT